MTNRQYQPTVNRPWSVRISSDWISQADKHDQQPHIEHRFALPEQHGRRDDEECDQQRTDPDHVGVIRVGTIEKKRREQVVSAGCQQRHRCCQGNGCEHPHGDPRRRSFRSRRRRRVRPLEQDIENDGNGKRRPPEDGDPRCGVDPGAKQAVRGKGAGKGERVRDEQQCGEDVARGQDGQGSRPKDGGLSVKQGGDDQVAQKHDRVDHRE